MKPQAGTSGASRRSCDRCGAAVLRQLVGQRAALKVTADAGSIPLAEALALAEPNRLAWCVAELHGGGVELRWRCARECGHGTVIEHRCPPGTPLTPKPEGALW